MNAIAEQFAMAGFVAWPTAALAAIASFLGALALILRSRGFVVATLFAVFLVGSLGVGGAWLGRRATEQVLAHVGPAQQERVRHAGYSEARSAPRIALWGAALPLLLGVAGLFVARRAGTSSDPKPSLAPEAVAAGTSLLGVGGAVAMISAPLPGPDLDRHDPTWELLVGVQAVELGQLAEGCSELAETRSDRYSSDGELLKADPSRVPGYDAAVTKCIDWEIDEAKGDRRRLLELQRNDRRLKPSAAQRARIDDLLKDVRLIGGGGLGTKPPPGIPRASAHAANSTLRMSKPVVKGSLPTEVVYRVLRRRFLKLRECHGRALERNPKLEGNLPLRFIIESDGKVGRIVQRDPPFPDSSAARCVLDDIQATPFPAPLGGIATVDVTLQFSQR